MIEDIIVAHDTRGMRALQEVLPPDFCRKAAQFLYDTMEKVLIVTGFYVSGFCETDGVVGAALLGDALVRLGSTVAMVTDRYCFDIVKALDMPVDVYLFPLVNEKESKEYADGLLSSFDPTIVVSVERCGRAKDGRYYNMHGEDITAYTAKIDVLFEGSKNIGVGDGGNEIGMGKVHDAVVKAVFKGEKIASVVETTHLVVSSVSNWGCYGLIAYLSLFEGELLLEREDAVLEKVVKAGAIDSGCKERVLQVDGFSLAVTNEIIDALVQIVRGG
jgi:hypothetical protein